MVPAGRVLAFALVALIIIVIPGPSVLFVVGRALAHGRRVALASVLGNEAGSLVLVGLVAAGVGPLVERSALIFTVMKLAGAAYLVFLGARAVLQRRRHVPAGHAAAAPAGWARAVLQGFTVGVSNPKTAVFFAAILPEFVDRSRGDVTVQMLLLGTVFALIATISDAAWSLVASGARAWFGRSPRRMELVGGTGGLAMIGLGITLAVTGRKS
ncbi:MAG TPA: LysE family translocator [Streptosporangiaceae bacterium]|nr:LysE family translocator [Streptosporangiaceae bacterium]